MLRGSTTQARSNAEHTRPGDVCDPLLRLSVGFSGQRLTEAGYGRRCLALVRWKPLFGKGRATQGQVAAVQDYVLALCV